ncbi:hypothetical protein CFC21_062220, partial [Triticum aestivum]
FKQFSSLIRMMHPPFSCM